MFGGAKLGHEGIVYRRVRAADANQAPRLTGAPSDDPVRIRVVHRDQPRSALTQEGLREATPARASTSRRTSRRISSRLLSSPAEIENRDDDGEDVARERVRPGHVAVLVRTNRNAALVREALEEAGIPAVINGAGSVFGTRPAARMASPAGGARAPDLAHARPFGRAHLLPRLVARARRRRRRGRLGGRAPRLA